jgi:FtsP/CotA-like multicopper oxidase with cupredoxin domain
MLHNYLHFPILSHLLSLVDLVPSGDDIFVRIDPQESHKYEYTIGTDHMPGTHWYHPHFHGSTALQTGQGAAGLIIIEDPDDYPLPEYIKTMPEVEMVLQNLNLHEHIRQAAAESEFYLSFQEGDGLNTTNTTTDITNLVLVNMQYVPKLEMQAGKWYRWRMVLSSYFDSIAMRLKEESDCEFQLLAKDGIYLTDAPRSVPGIILSPGNRADVAVRCNKIGHTKVLSFDPYLEPAQSGISFAQDNFRPFSNFNMQPEIMLLDVVSSEEDTDEDIEHFDLQRPCYLVDLTDVDASEIEKNFTVSLHCHDLPVCRNLTINGKQWENKDTYLETFSLGRVQEISEYLNI